MLCEMLPIAKRIARDRQYQPIFFPQKHYKFSDSQLNLIKVEGFDFFSPAEHPLERLPEKNQKEENEPLASSRLNLWLSGIFQQIWGHLLPKLLREILETRRDFVFQIQEAHSFLKIKNVAALVLIGDRHIGWETAFIKAANERKIPSLIVPFALSSPVGNARYRLLQPDCKTRFGTQTRLGRWVARFFPKWVFAYRGEKLFFYPPANALAAWLAGIMPKNPWLIGNGAATRMAVESQWLKRLYLQQGIKAEKMIVTGKPSLDDLAADIQRNSHNHLRHAMNLPEETHIVLLAVPQFAEHKMLSWEDHWKEMDFLFSTLSQLPNTRLVLSLHPSSDPQAYQSIAEKYGAAIARERYFTLLSGCDVFIAAESSTVLTAIGVCKPTLVLGYYHWHEGIYDDAPGVVTVRKQEDTAPAVMHLLNDRAYYEELAEAQQKRSSDWILLDGKCTERVVNELYRLIETSKPKSAGKNGNN